MGRDQVDDALYGELCVDQLLQPFDQIRALGRIGDPALDDQYGLLATLGARYGKGQGVPGPDFRLLFCDLLEILRPDVPAVDDNHVFLAAGQIQVAANPVANVTGFQPAILGQHLAGSLEVPEIARHDARAPHI